MKVTYRQASRDDVTRQFRYYLVKLNLPDVAIRFKEGVRKTVKAISQQPRIAPLYHLGNPQLQNLRFWPVAGFEAIRLYFVLENETMRVIRILHGKQDVRGILERERSSEN
ncbi:MAG TPA: type II toxin-antitoxin system RelE/ParE family toxin [Candidatus Solibacter sp.]|nr:type II toxin-antitoxin system RelE/ParE family toxin [Candidatus Solibacter sp.]